MYDTTDIIGILTIVGFASLSGEVLLNEIDADTPGTDNAEFVELYQVPGPGDASLNGYALVFFNGADGSDSAYRVMDLNGYSFSPSGYFVVGDSGVANVDLSFGPGAETDHIQNGTDAVALYSGLTAEEFVAGTRTGPVDNLDLVDFIIYRGGTEEDSSLSSVFPPSDQPDEDLNGEKSLQSIQRNPDGGFNFIAAAPSPGQTNTQLPRIKVVPSPVQVDEDAGAGASTIVVTREGSLDSSLSVNIISTGSLTRISAPPTTAFFGVGVDQISFSIDTIPNTSIEGDGFIEFEISEDTGPGGEPSYQTGKATLIVADDELSYPTLVVNEVLLKGEESNGPEFVELYNSGNTGVTLDGFQVEFYAADPEGGFGALQQSFTIASGSIPAKGFFTIGNPQVTSVYGVNLDQTVSGLDLPDEDTCMVLLNGGGGIVFSALIEDGELDAVPNSEGTALAAEVFASSAGEDSPAGYYLTSDGGEASNSLELVGFGERAPSATPTVSNVVAPRLLLSRDRELIEEDSTEVITFTVSRIPDTVGDVTVTLFSDDTTELVLPGTVVIPDGQASVTFAGVPQQDGVRDGLSLVRITASASGLLSAASEATVLDADIPDLQVCDIAFVAAITDQPEVFAFVALSEIYAGTRITFTDYGWHTNGEFLIEEGDGQMTWLAIADVPAGTVVTFTENEPDVGTAASGGIDLGESGDQIFAYQGDSDNPTFLAGIQLNGAWDSEAVDSATSSLPAALASEGAVSIEPGSENAVYSGSTQGSLESLKGQLFSSSGFTASDAREDAGPDLIPSAFTFTAGVEYAVEVTGFAINPEGATVTFEATGSSDVYVSSDLVTWELANGGEGVGTGTYLDENPPAGKAFYLVQEAGAEAP
ncbi:lamin tail domain-containing protein [Roseibacillus persicicus]|uniref:lamin tail domain-containing protein n=1 Tax=Roseibacillus persicicus TaxID=454148 RepID=UPI00398B3F98